MILPVSYNMNNIWTSCETISFSITTMGHEVLNFRYMSIPITFPTLYALQAKRRLHALLSVGPLTYRAGKSVDRIQVGSRHFSLLRNVHAASGALAFSYSIGTDILYRGLQLPGLSVRHSPSCGAVDKVEIVRLHFDISTALSHYIYTGYHRRNGPNFGRVFLMLKYTDITQNTYIQS